MRDMVAVLLGILIGVAVSAYKEPITMHPDGFVMDDANAMVVTYITMTPTPTFTPTH